LVVALPDIRPAAAQHLLVLPREHISNVSSLTAADAQLGELQACPIVRSKLEPELVCEFAHLATLILPPASFLAAQIGVQVSQKFRCLWFIPYQLQRRFFLVPSANRAWHADGC
jgi:hypothetical protein